MIVMNLETEMPGRRYFSLVDTLALKSQIERKIGPIKAEKYFNLLTRFLSLKIGKPEFDRLCIGIIGRENVRLHNHLLRSIIRNASLSKNHPSTGNKLEGALSVKAANGYQRSNLKSMCKDFPQSPRKGRTTNLRDQNHPSPLGPHGKSRGTVCEDAVPRVQEQQSATELLSLGSRPPMSFEEGEEVDQVAGSPSIHSRSPVRAPLGISLNAKGMRKVPWNRLASASETCHCKGELPDTGSLRKRLEKKLEMEGLNMSVDCANLLNSSLDVFMKRLIKPCLELAGSRSGQKLIDQGHNWSTVSLNGMRPLGYAQKQNGSISASMLDFRVAMEINSPLLGVDWPTKLEKVCLHASEE
ncbi:hypothetical protein E1A91_D11G225300v1 [Gossypium mustelinum]|uniref:Transcriptional coactivator Hfi1/Transcriptional adapter 1 n=2 Tax=Gossypium mustelinum TaxID=34275 RepID=A0A5D2SWD5_GOSMU|nr:hypothetical protein E1A91_D11G225300v1 [Gossypium mustelinum]